jgi:hypothetical protein
MSKKDDGVLRPEKEMNEFERRVYEIVRPITGKHEV